MIPHPRKHLIDIEKYHAGKSVKGLIKLSSNEVTWGPSASTIRALKKITPLAYIYPESQSVELRSLIAKFNNVNVDNVIIGNGSNEIIQFVLQAYLEPHEHVLISEKTFSMYKIYSNILNINVKIVPLNKKFEIDLSEIKKRITKNTKLIFLTTPNNPTGLILNKLELKKFINEVPKDKIIIIDEAYLDFCASNLKFKLSNNPNILVLKTFSKAFGMAGLRLGYGIASKDIIINLQKMGQHFNVNSFAITAGIESLKNLKHYNNIVSKTIIGRDYIQNSLKKLNIPFLYSHANFIMIYVKNAKKAFDLLASKGIIVRELSSFGFPEYIRVTISNQSHNKKFIAALKDVYLSI